MNIEVEELRNWFLKEKRSFPWRLSPTPYRVWISEVMLQQTQAPRVLLYFEKWMERFPTVEALAAADEASVLKMWEGLGYYSRARALHETAKRIVRDFAGQMPSQEEQLRTLKGLGPYTTSAILAFAFHQKIAAVDGNVLRVISRLFEIDDEITKLKTHTKIRELTNSLLPEKNAWEITEAFIELGATICKPKNPLCDLCPLKMSCQSFRNGAQSQFPVKAKKVQYETLVRQVAVIIAEDRVLLRQGKEGQVMAGLWEFPYFEGQRRKAEPEEFDTLFHTLGLHGASFLEDLQEERHSYTRFRVTLYPKLFSHTSPRVVKEHEWVPCSQLLQLAFSSGHKRILEKFVSIAKF